MNQRPKMKPDVKRPEMKPDAKRPEMKPDVKSPQMTTSVKSPRMVTRSSSSEVSVAVEESSVGQNVERSSSRKRRNSSHSSCAMCNPLEPNSKGDCKERLAISNGNTTVSSLRKRSRNSLVGAVAEREISGGVQKQKAKTVEAKGSGCSFPVLRLTQVTSHSKCTTQSQGPRKMTVDEIKKSHRWQPYVKIKKLDFKTCTTINGQTLNFPEVEAGQESLKAESRVVSSELLVCESVPAEKSAPLQNDVNELPQQPSESEVVKAGEDKSGQFLEDDAQKSPEKVEKPSEDKVETPPEDKVEKPPEDKVEKPSEDHVETPSEDKLEKPPEDKLEKPSEDKVEKPSENFIQTSNDEPDTCLEDKPASPSANEAGQSSKDTSDHPSENKITESAEDENDKCTKVETEHVTLESKQDEGLKSSEEEIGKSSDDMDCHCSEDGQAVNVLEGDTARSSNGETENESLKSSEVEGLKSSEDETSKLPKADTVAFSDVMVTETAENCEADVTQPENVDTGKSDSENIDMLSVNDSNNVVETLPEPSSISKINTDKCQDSSEVDNIIEDMKEVVIETSNTTEKIIDYLKSNLVPKKSSIDIIKFAEHLGLVPKEVETEILQSVGQLKSISNGLECFEWKAFRAFLDNKVERGESAEQMFNCVNQMIRSMSAVDPTLLHHISVDHAFKCDHVMNFLQQINDNVISAVYAKSYTYLIEFILQMCGRLPASKKRCVSSFKTLLSQFCAQKETPSVSLSNNFITRHPAILDRVNEHLSMQCIDYSFILNYLNAYLCLECLKPTWSFREATLNEYTNSVIIGGCQVMLVINKSLWCVVVWRKEAMRLLHHYVNMFRFRNSKVQNLFLNFLTKTPLTNDLNIANWISNVGQDEKDKEQFMKYFNLHMNRLSKHVQTNPFRGFNTVPTSTCSTQTESEPVCPPEKEADSCRPLTADNLKQGVDSALSSSTTPPRVTDAQKQRTVGIQCSFKILMKTNHNHLTNSFYDFTPINNQMMLVPAAGVQTTETGTDPLVIPKRHVKAQTRSVVISQRENVTKSTQTDDTENASYFLVVPSSSDCPMTMKSPYGTLVVAQPTDDLNDVTEQCYLAKTFEPVHQQLSADKQSDSSTSQEPVSTVSESEVNERMATSSSSDDDDDVAICSDKEDKPQEEEIEAPTAIIVGSHIINLKDKSDDDDDDDEPIIVEEIVSPSAAASSLVSNRRINTVDVALKYWPPSVDGKPLTFQQTGLSRDNYLHYHRAFCFQQTNLRAKAIVNNLRVKYKKISDSLVEKEAQIHNWVVDKTLLARCYSNFMYKSV